MSTMTIDPSYVSIGGLLFPQNVYVVPKYQRGYAWGETEVEDFIKDIRKCFNARISQNSMHHFFGGIVSVRRNVTGAAHIHEYEIVDGQQRVVTFVMLMLHIADLYERLSKEAEEAGNSSLHHVLLERVKRLRNTYLEVDLEINRQIQSTNKLSLSKPDNALYQDLVRSKVDYSSFDRESHERMYRAYGMIGKFVNSILEDQSHIDIQLESLERITEIVDEDCTVIHIVTHDKKDAYRLFQVLNDRGISLTEGDLLRARTLEMLDDPLFKAQQDSVENAWNSILIDPPTETERYLRWIYESYKGGRPGKSTLFDNFLDAFYPQHTNHNISVAEANAVVSTTITLKREFENCRHIVKGDWPIDLKKPLTLWHANRLRLLVVELGHTNCLPLLLSSCLLDPAKFNEIVQLTERFFFRYKLICNEHIGSLNRIYQLESVKVRSNPSSYMVSSYRSALQDLQKRKATDMNFSSLIPNALQYSKGSSNKPLKYFLITAENFYRWFEKGHQGDPQCLDMNTVYDFSSTTIEHIYPQNADSAHQDSTLEPVKHSIGNLTILSTDDNEMNDNSDFDTKKHVLHDSSAHMNSVVASYSDWNLQSVQERSKVLTELATHVFKA